ncbi:MerR family transcriptional regulator [Bacillus sp. B-jedd]|uniref:MerR family transcriptional regulator n=1 Tax=Bacillus sp. B-jedd TaxID=1476857 RepID=UPI0005156CD7|nr:MerR family transcriptional regulator [Bacillus sp. B-jedd]CEG27681.1 MerR family transcriptional regulator [Bacillus sp. B-jedd]
MKRGKGKYNIKAASSILGIKPGTLRAWEKRYNIISPHRNESGHRLYSEEQIFLLQNVLEKVEKGFTISQAAAQIEVSRGQKDTNGAVLTQADHYIQEIIDACNVFDEESANIAMDTCFKLFSIEAVLEHILIPAIKELNKLKDMQKMDSASYCFGMAFFRARLGIVSQCARKSSIQPKAMAVSLEQGNELEFLCFFCFLKLKGYDAVYLAGRIGKEDLEEAVRKFEPHFLFLSFAGEKNMEDCLSLSKHYGSLFPQLKIGISGIPADLQEKTGSEWHSEMSIGDDPDEWEKWLAKKERP